MEENKIEKQENLEYKLGGLIINPEEIDYIDLGSMNQNHRFIIEARGAKGKHLNFYAAQVYRHVELIDKFNLGYTKIVGGGSIFMSPNRHLCLSGKSYAYGSIPNEIVKNYEPLLLSELKKDFEIKKFIVHMDEDELNKYWKEMGFKEIEKFSYEDFHLEDFDEDENWKEKIISKKTSL